MRFGLLIILNSSVKQDYLFTIISGTAQCWSGFYLFFKRFSCSLCQDSKMQTLILTVRSRVTSWLWFENELDGITVSLLRCNTSVDIAGRLILLVIDSGKYCNLLYPRFLQHHVHLSLLLFYTFYCRWLNGKPYL